MAFCSSVYIKKLLQNMKKTSKRKNVTSFAVFFFGDRYFRIERIVGLLFYHIIFQNLRSNKSRSTTSINCKFRVNLTFCKSKVDQNRNDVRFSFQQLFFVKLLVPDHNILRFDISMHNSLTMQKMQNL